MFDKAPCPFGHRIEPPLEGADKTSGARRFTMLRAGVLLVSGFTPAGARGSYPGQLSLEGAMNSGSSLVSNSMATGVSAGKTSLTASPSKQNSLGPDGKTEIYGQCTTTFDDCSHTTFESSEFIKFLEELRWTTTDEFDFLSKDIMTVSVTKKKPTSWEDLPPTMFDFESFRGLHYRFCLYDETPKGFERLWVRHLDNAAFSSLKFQSKLPRLTNVGPKDIEIIKNMGDEIKCVYKGKNPDQRGEINGLYFWKVHDLWNRHRPDNCYCFALNKSATPDGFKIFWIRQRQPEDGMEAALVDALETLNNNIRASRENLEDWNFIVVDTGCGSQGRGNWRWNGQPIERYKEDEVKLIMKEGDGEIIWERDFGSGETIKVLALEKIPPQLAGKIIQKWNNGVGEFKNIIGKC